MSQVSVSRLLYANKQWVLTKEFDPKVGYATFVVNPRDFPGQDIQKFWSKNANVSYVSWSDKSWVVVADSPLDPNTRPVQGMAVQEEFPKDKIQTAWNEGWAISNLYFGDRLWVLFKEKPVNPANKSPAQNLVMTADFPAKEMEEAWANHRRVRSLAVDAEGSWVLITDQFPEYANPADAPPVQCYYAQEGDFPFDQVTQKLKGGWLITHIVFGEKSSIWAFVFEKAGSKHTQTISVTSDFPKLN